MTELISTLGMGTVLLVLLIGIPAIVNFIKWCKGLWAFREQFKQENIQKGKEIEARTEEKENRLKSGESRIELLEKAFLEMQKINKDQNEQIALLRESDKLSIKTWIKEQHEKWIKLGCIDNYTLDLLEERYAIYAKEGGNSWAKKLMDELRALPPVTVVAVQNNHENQ